MEKVKKKFNKTNYKLPFSCSVNSFVSSRNAAKVICDSKHCTNKIRLTKFKCNTFVMSDNFIGPLMSPLDKLVRSTVLDLLSFRFSL